jgi:hypothetical protein
MTYEPTENDQLVSDLMAELKALDADLHHRLSDARATQITEAEDRSVLQHGRAILAMIEGTTWAPDGSVSTREVGEEPWAE